MNQISLLRAVAGPYSEARTWDRSSKPQIVHPFIHSNLSQAQGVRSTGQDARKAEMSQMWASKNVWPRVGNKQENSSVKEPW